MAVIRIQLTLRLEPEVRAKLKWIADLESRSMANMIDWLIKREIARYEKLHGVINLSEEEVYPE